MAYVPAAGIAQRPEDDERQRRSQAPSLGAGSGGGGGFGGGGASTAPSTAGASPAAPKSTPGMGVSQSAQGSSMQPRGSGYINLQSFLTPTVAGQNQEAVKSTGNALDAGARQQFGGAVNTAMTGINANAAQTADAGTLQNAVRAAGVGSESATGFLRGLLGQSFTGPTGVDFDVTGNENVKRLAGLSNNSTALDALHPELRGNLQYTPGNRWLDQSMIQSDQGTNDQIAAAKKKAGDLGSWMDEQAGVVSAAAAKKAGEIDAARLAAQQGLRGIGQGYLTEAQRQADAANQRESSDFAGQILRDPNTGEIVAMPTGNVLAGWEAGAGPATSGNFLGSQQSGQLRALADLLGDPSLAVSASGPWHGGRWTTQQNLDQVGELADRNRIQLAPAGNLRGGQASGEPGGGSMTNNGGYLEESGRYESMPDGSTVDHKTGFVYDNWWTIQNGEWVNRQTGERRPYEPTPAQKGRG